MEALLSSSRLPRRCLLRPRSSHLCTNPKTMVPPRWCWVRCTTRHSTTLRARPVVAVAGAVAAMVVAMVAHLMVVVDAAVVKVDAAVVKR